MVMMCIGVSECQLYQQFLAPPLELISSVLHGRERWLVLQYREATQTKGWVRSDLNFRANTHTNKELSTSGFPEPVH